MWVIIKFRIQEPTKGSKMKSPFYLASYRPPSTLNVRYDLDQAGLLASASQVSGLKCGLPHPTFPVLFGHAFKWLFIFFPPVFISKVAFSMNTDEACFKLVLVIWRMPQTNPSRYTLYIFHFLLCHSSLNCRYVLISFLFRCVLEKCIFAYHKYHT